MNWGSGFCKWLYGSMLAIGVIGTSTGAAAAPVSLFPSSATPAVLSENDPNAVELGVKFRASAAGKVLGIRYYKSPNDKGTHTGSLWGAGGARLRRATFVNETASGWQTMKFAAPVSIKANTTYIASFHSNGNYSYSSAYFVKSYSNGQLSAPAGANGVYRYGASGFPNQTYQSTNYWVDVLFEANVGPSPTPTPVPTATPIPTPTPVPTPTPSPTPAPPTVSLGVSPSVINVGQSANLTYSYSNASSCVASGFAFSGSMPSGSATVSVSPSASTAYSLSCQNSGGSTVRSAMLTVNQPTTGAIFYVAANGSDNGTGSSTAPFRSISRAMQANLKPGDTVLVRPGTYNEPYGISMKSGSAAGYITLKSEVPRAALIRTDSYAAVYMGNYSIIDGFDIKAASHAVFNNEVHHVIMRNNYTHDCGESGLGAMHSDFITIEGNEVYNPALFTWGSGISIYEPRNFTNDSTPGVRIIIRNNISHGNFQTGPPYTDGNGIIMDDFHHGQNAGWPNYTFPSLVEGNVVYNNGGKGIAVHWSDNVTIRNNTSYHNNRDNKNTTTWRGELSQQDSANNTWVNNIAVANTSTNAANTAIGFYGGNSNTKWFNNLTFNGVVGQASLRLEGGNNPAPTAANGNKLGVDPKLFAPASGDFRLQAVSPAIDAGTNAFGVGTLDVSGNPRVNGVIDMGAYEY